MTSADLSRRYEPRGGALDLWWAREPEIMLCGPSGTGKTRAALEKVLYLALAYPNVRVLLLRKTRASMTESVLAILEDHVFPLGHYAVGTVARSHRLCYHLHNDSRIVIAGLDSATRIMSAQYDLVVVHEATEIEEHDWEMLLTRLRNGSLSYQQAIADCNPAGPTHWLMQRVRAGQLRYIRSRHEDNPTVTPEYLARLDRLTGFRRDRLFLGEWVGASGAVYPDFSTCIVEPYETIPDGRFYGGVDFGWNDPFAAVAGVWYRGGDGRQYLYVWYERYKTATPMGEHVIALQRAVGTSGGIWWADPSRPDTIRDFIVAGLTVRGARNDILPGVDRINGLIAAGRLKVSSDCRALIAEAAGYCYPAGGTGERPAPGFDHALDALRYLVMALPREADDES